MQAYTQARVYTYKDGYALPLSYVSHAELECVNRYFAATEHRPLHSLKRKLRFKTHKSLGKSKAMIMGSDRSRKQD